MKFSSTTLQWQQSISGTSFQVTLLSVAPSGQIHVVGRYYRQLNVTDSELDSLDNSYELFWLV